MTGNPQAVPLAAVEATLLNARRGQAAELEASEQAPVDVMVRLAWTGGTVEQCAGEATRWRHGRVFVRVADPRLPDGIWVSTLDVRRVQR